MIKEKARKKSIKIKEKDLLVLEKEVEKSRLAIVQSCL